MPFRLCGCAGILCLGLVPQLCGWIGSWPFVPCLSQARVDLLVAQTLAIHQVDAILHHIPWSDLQADRGREAVSVRFSERVFVHTRAARSLSQLDESA